MTTAESQLVLRLFFPKQGNPFGIGRYSGDIDPLPGCRVQLALSYIEFRNQNYGALNNN